MLSFGPELSTYSKYWKLQRKINGIRRMDSTPVLFIRKLYIECLLNWNLVITNIQYIYKTCQAYFCCKSLVWNMQLSFIMHYVADSSSNHVLWRPMYISQWWEWFPHKGEKEIIICTYLQNWELLLLNFIMDRSLVINLLWKSETLYCVFHKFLCTIRKWRSTGQLQWALK